MRKIHLLLILAFSLSCILCTQVHSFNNLKDQLYILKDDEEWDEILAEIMTGTGRPRAASARTASTATSSVSTSIRPVRIFKNAFFLKLNLSISETVAIKITDTDNSRVYSTKFVPGKSNDILVNIAGWESGKYNITFTNTSGVVIAKATVEIN